MLTGVTSNTKHNYQLGAGVVCTGFSNGVISGIIGATRGGGSFTAVPTIRQPEVDGLPDNTKDFKIIDFWVATLTTTIFEATETSIKLALAGGSASTSASVTTITAKQGIVENAAYADLWWVGDTSDGNKIAIKLSNALGSNGFNFNFVDRGEGTFELQAIAHYSVDDLSTPPFTIYLDKTTSPTSAVELSSITPADGSTGAVATVVLTFNNAISTENVFITLASDGSIIAGTKTWDSTRKILTFTPTTAFTAAKHYVNIVSVVDIYGQALANTITDFTVE
jgi:hypothetical protein